MRYVQGDILTLEGFMKGYISIDKRKGLFEVRKGSAPEKPIAHGLIVPSFINAHTHIGDSFIRKKHLTLPRNLQDLVAPPYGLKHRLLHDAKQQEIIAGIQTSLQEMAAAGVSWFCDFREGGIIGVFELKKALKNSTVKSVILSRPSQLSYDKEELDRLLQNSQGIGLSSVSDWEYSKMEKVAQHVRKKKKIFALHASEIIREDIDRILDLKPSFLVHMIAGTKSDLERVKDAEIPIVVCPRSYEFFHLKTNFPLLKSTGVTLLMGSDNAMINPPSVLEEIQIMLKTGLFSFEELLVNTTYTSRKALNLEDGILGPNQLADFVVLERETLKPLYVSR